MLQAVTEPSILQLGEPVRGNRRASAIASETLEPLTIAGGYRDIRVEAQAGRIRAARRWSGFQVLGILGIDAISETQEPLSSAGARGDTPLDRGRGERHQQRILLDQRIGLRRISILTEAVLLQELRQLVGHVNDHPDHLFIAGRRKRVEARGAVVGDFVDAVEGERVHM